MNKKLLVSIVMGSQSDWKILSNAAQLLSEFKFHLKKKSFQLIEHQIDYTNMQNLKPNNIEVVIAGAGGAAHLSIRMIAALTTIPILGVPVESKSLKE